MKNIEYYKKNNLPIPVELVSTGKVNLNDKIIYKCEECGMEYVCKYSTLKFRKEKPSELICNNCINKIFDLNLKPTVPFELQKYNKDNPVPWDIFIKYNEKYNSKKWITIKCKDCGKESIVRWDKIANRKYAKNEPICNKCIMKHVTNLEEWKKVNSEAQLIAQNRPDVKEKRNVAVKKACNTIIARKNKSNAAKKIWKNPEYRKKILNDNNIFLKGYYNNIRFDSSWELSFLIYFKNKVKRADDMPIPYKYMDEKHTYYPDFILNNDGKNILVEVKGVVNEIVMVKSKFAKQFISNNNCNIDEYKLFDYNELIKLKNFRFIDCMEKVQSIINTDNLIITSYPKNWIKK